MAIAIGIRTVAGVVGKERGTTLEFGVRGSDSGVDDIHTCVCSGGAVVGIRTATASLVGDASKTPSGRRLSDVCLLLDVLNLTKVGLDNSILLDVFDTWENTEELNNVIAHLSSEPAKASKLVNMGRILLEKLQSTLDEILQVLILQLDNVLSRNWGTCTGCEQWSWNRSWSSIGQSWQEREEESELHDGCNWRRSVKAKGYKKLVLMDKELE